MHLLANRVRVDALPARRTHRTTRTICQWLRRLFCRYDGDTVHLATDNPLQIERLMRALANSLQPILLPWVTLRVLFGKHRSDGSIWDTNRPSHRNNWPTRQIRIAAVRDSVWMSFATVQPLKFDVCSGCQLSDYFQRCSTITSPDHSNVRRGQPSGF